MPAAAPALPHDRGTRSDRLVVLVLAYVAFIILGMFDGVLGVAFALMRADFAVGLDAISAILIPSTAGFLLSSFVVGRVLSRFTMGAVLAAAGTLRALGFLLIATAPQWWVVSAAALLLGFSAGFIDAGLNTWFATRFSARLMNWLHACFGIGATLAPLLLTVLLRVGYSWRAGFLLIMVLQGAIALAALLTLRRWQIAPLPLPPHEATGAAAPETDVPRSQTLRLPAVWIGILVFFFYTGVELTTGNWAFTIFSEVKGVDVTRAATWTTIVWGSFTLSRILFGFFELRSVSGTIRVVLLVALGGALLLALSTAPWLALPAIVAMHFSVAPVFALLVSETPLRLGRAHAQHAIGLQVGAAAFGGAVLPSVAGAIAEATSAAMIPWVLVAALAVLWTLHEVMSRMHVNGRGAV